MLQPSRKYLLALDAVLYIAYHAGIDPVSSKDISAAIGFPQRYLEQMMQKLVRFGILKGVRGPRGGYFLAKDRRKLTVGEVCQVLDDSEASDKDEVGSVLGRTILEPLWNTIERDAFNQLHNVSFEELCGKAAKQGIPIASNQHGDFII